MSPQWEVQERKDVRVIGFSDPSALDTLNISLVAKEILRDVKQTGPRHLVLDMAKITMLSSQSLGLFLNLRQMIAGENCKVVFCALDPRLQRVFKVTNLQQVFDFYDTVDQALAALA